jgi:mono/diheme cytochrome c family protein
MPKLTLARALAGGAAALVLIQIIPYGRNHTNPPVTGSPEWDSQATEATFDRVCANCHSNRTLWPWYSNIAPASWLVQNDVDGARAHFNVSEWGANRLNAGSLATHEVRGGDMPPLQYWLFHPEARLSEQEKEAFIQGLAKTFPQAPARAKAP